MAEAAPGREPQIGVEFGKNPQARQSPAKQAAGDDHRQRRGDEQRPVARDFVQDIGADEFRHHPADDRLREQEEARGHPQLALMGRNQGRRGDRPQQQGGGQTQQRQEPGDQDGQERRRRPWDGEVFPTKTEGSLQSAVPSSARSAL